MARELAPTTFDAARAALAEAAAERETVRIIGAGTKQAWAPSRTPADVEIYATGLDRILEHNAGDLTAVLEAGVPLARAQRQFAQAGQMLALDPDLGPGQAATIGGIVASADSGPLRHRYGAARDLIVGITVALSDGTVARAGGKVIKNVAGYDLGKLFTGSFGTLGLILSVNVRLHPLPAATATALAPSDDPDQLAAAAAVLAAAPLELEALDVTWRDGRGGILAQCAGARAIDRAQAIARVLREQTDIREVEVADRDAELWARQRAGQRSTERALVRVATRPGALAQLLRAAAECSAALVGRAALGVSYVELEPAAVDTLIARLPAGAVHMLLDAPPGTPPEVERWGPAPGAPALELMRRVKLRFDPAGVCSPGALVGGI